MMDAECRTNTDAVGKRPAFFLYSRPWIALGLLTLFAGAIRFFHLSHPCLWYDESMVFWRTCGSYGQLLNCLRTDGFVPLHYSLIWVLSRFFRPTPVLLRFIPALSGTLMVPAVYFLARQLVSIRTALLAAAFAACSGFLLFYSRDAKMYMDAWLMVTLNMACLLWWFRSNNLTSWLCWIATGCAACGLHATSTIPVGFSLLLLFTQSKMRWQQTLLWLVGILVIFAGPIGYYEKFNRWEDRVNDDGWKDSGLQWIGAYNHGRSDAQLVRFFATTTLMGWEWPRDEDVKLIPPARVAWPARGAILLLGIAIAACLPWPRKLRSTLVLRYSKEPDLPPQPQWRIALWLCFWIILPLYGFYCRSVPNFASPADLEIWLHPTRFRVVLCCALIAALIGLMIRYPRIRPKFYRGVNLLLVIALVLLLCEAIAIGATFLSSAATENHSPWQSVWVPRYMGFIWPALAIAVAGLIMRLPTRVVRSIAILLLLGMNLSIGAYRILGQTEPPVDLMAADYLDAQNPSHRTLTWMHLKRGALFPGGGNLFSGPGEYYLDLLQNKAVTPVQFRQAVNILERTNNTSPFHRKLPGDLKQIIIWDQQETQEVPPSEWKLQSQDWFNTRDCWIWKDLSRYERRVYVRQ